MTTKSDDATQLPSEAEWLLSELWRHVHECEDDEISDRQIRLVARLVGVCARRLDMHPQRLIIAVKDSWSSHDALREPNERQRLLWVLNEVLSACIDAFYRTDGSASVLTLSEERRSDEGPPLAKSS